MNGKWVVWMWAAGVWVAAGAVWAGPAAGAGWWADGNEYMVAADHEAASAAGAAILARGGNAVDAAVAVSFTLAVVRPESCGLGGGGFLVLYRPGQPAVVLDFRETAPAGAELRHYLDAQGKPIGGKTTRGVWAAAVPGEVRGVLLALERYGSGKLSRRDVLRPAIELARRGVVVDQCLHEAMKGLEKVAAAGGAGVAVIDRSYTELLRSFLKDGRAYEIGERVDRSDLAATIEAISHEGADGFYRGPIAERIVKEIQRRGGPMTLKDLAEYQVRVLQPLRGAFGPYEVITMPPPSSGGAVILQVLNVLAAREANIAQCWPATAEGAHLLIEAMKHGFADRAALLGDRSEAVLADVGRMISPAYGRAVSARIDPARTQPTKAYGSRTVREDGGTSHFSVVDSRGWAVACTETINLGFGSYVMVPGTGIILNNEMDDLAADTITPNALGLRQSERNLIAPGRRPLSSMSPTIVLRDGKVVLVVGGSGGPRIISATLEVLLNVLARGMEVDRAVSAPRMHHQWLPEEVLVEHGVPAEIVDGLRARGHAVREYSGSPGNVQAIGRQENGWRGASDPNKGGRPAGR